MYEEPTTVIIQRYLDGLPGGVVAGLLTALRATRPPTVRRFFALANRHMRWQFNDLARRLAKRSAAAAPAGGAAGGPSPGHGEGASDAERHPAP
jgi:RNA polymerase sigma-70 factor (ECF subfamily)